jgi:hypothetical protein
MGKWAIIFQSVMIFLLIGSKINQQLALSFVLLGGTSRPTK